MNNEYLGGESRRQAVRVEDRLLFSFNPVSPDQYAALQEDFNRGIPPYIQDGLTEIQMYIGTQSALARIQQRDEDMGRFLQHLDTKINMLLQKVAGGTSPFDKMDLREVIISSAGLSFPADAAVDSGTIMEFNLVLLPDYTYIYCIGEVVESRKNEAEDDGLPCIVSCKFTLIMEEDREKLVQHNFKQQSLALRNRRLNRDS